jgi:hypothetical protein
MSGLLPHHLHQRPQRLAPLRVVSTVVVRRSTTRLFGSGRREGLELSLTSRGQTLCRCITGGLRLGAGVGRLVIADSIVDQQAGVAIGGVPDDTREDGGPPAPHVQLERVTVLGSIRCEVLSTSESLLDDRAEVEERQLGCIRFSRYEPSSVLPRRYRCIPDENDLRCGEGAARCLAPVFNSRRFGRPDYLQLAATCPAPIRTGSESGAEVGAFAALRHAVRLRNLETKLREFLPVGLTATVIAET